ncbi:hypothetical protein KXX17_000893 [Aspergillus fumigatus]|nr:hypothetical protein KXX17_000893 [Aspergillus fumigatus]
MIGATRRWFRRNRKGLAIGAGIIGAGYLAGQYVLSKITEAREQMSSDRIAREKYVTFGFTLIFWPNEMDKTSIHSLRRRFEQNQTDCTYTVLALLPTAAEGIVEALPVEELTKELQKKRAERLARLQAGEGTVSDLSSVSPSAADDDRRSLSSFQSDGFVRTSQVGESSFDGEGPARVKRNKTQLWNEVKITSVTRSFTLIYTLSLLTIFTRIQLNLLGRRNYLSSVISLATPPANTSTIKLEDHDDDDLTQTLGNDFETNRRYLAFSWWLLHRGWKDLMNEVQAAVTDAFGSLNPREDISVGRLSELTLDIRKKVEGNTPEERRYRSRRWLPYLLPPREEEEHLLEESGVAGVTEPTTSQSASTLRHLLDETADLIESPTFGRVLQGLNDEFVPQVKTADVKTKLANVLAVMARQAHVIGNGTNPPNIYLSAMDQNVRNLEAFAAVIYSSNFDFQLPGAEQKEEQVTAERDHSDTSSTAPVMVDKDDTQDLNQASPSAVAENNSAFEKAWGKAVESSE